MKLRRRSLIILSGVFLACNSNVEKAKKLSINMSISQVKNIMGEPDDSVKGYFDTSKIMFVYKTPFLNSSDINIYFDSTTRNVTNIELPKGE